MLFTEVFFPVVGNLLIHLTVLFTSFYLSPVVPLPCFFWCVKATENNREGSVRPLLVPGG